jgi:mannose/fructose/N-acetylgalactosamine-specific phosphotransferase system component IID
MYIVPIAWLYVSLMMAVAEATNTNGTVLGALVTFVLYGLLPIGLIVYFMGSKGRKRAIKARELAEMEAKAAQAQAKAQPLVDPDGSSHAATDPIAPVRKEP